MSDTLVEEVTELAIDLGDERPHFSCCLDQEKFICGRPFHPELRATDEDNEDDCCVECVDLAYQTLCPPHKPSHAHCPLALIVVCPNRA